MEWTQPNGTRWELVEGMVANRPTVAGVCNAIRRDTIEQLWREAANGRNGLGLERCGYFPELLRHIRWLKDKNLYRMAGALAKIAAGGNLSLQ